MIHRAVFALLAGLLFNLASLPALAVETTFSYTIEHNYFSDSESYVTIYDNIDFSDKFDLYKENSILTDVTLYLNFAGTNADKEKNENCWTLFPASTNNNFSLIKTDSTTFVDQEFHLTANELAELMTTFETDNIFILTFYEKTQNNEVDSFYLNSARVVANYQAVPIPGAALLLAPTLIGIVAYRRKFSA